ncbi:MAG: class I SAM-dependent methyltransferase [Chlorobi bacterium]|nr:class I SAM-dependent methyltransferase [Chlorobiota bacterium]
MITISNCQICNNKVFIPLFSTKDHFFTGETFSVSQCGECGFVFTNPVPDKEKISEYYRTDKYLSHDTSGNGLMGNIYKIIRGLNLKNKSRLISKYKAKGRLLDIGSGTGEFLNYMKNKQFEAVGVEPEQKARDFAINNYGLDIRDESFFNKLPDKKFDLISMWHVLEHVYDINTRLQQIHELLYEDGYFINALPMIDSPDSKKFGKYWAGLDLPRHLHHFSSITFSLLAKNNGFYIIDKYPMKFDAYFLSLLSHQAKKNILAPIRGFLDGFISNSVAFKNKNYSSMIFVLKKV